MEFDFWVEYIYKRIQIALVEGPNELSNWVGNLFHGV